jgi:hypothetical protein
LAFSIQALNPVFLLIPIGCRKEIEMRTWHNYTGFTYEKSAKMSKIDIGDTLRSVFVHFVENLLLEWYPRLFPQEKHLAPAFAKNLVISESYLIFLVEP